MGGGYYDRDVYSSERSSSGFSFSSKAEEVIGAPPGDPAVSALGRNLLCENENPIVICKDVTGSMGNWLKTLFDKMPMMYGQIKMQNYLTDPAISFAANGDATCDKYPIQVCDFATDEALDELLTKIHLEKMGGEGARESYEIIAYFYAFHCDISAAKTPFFFFLCDEGMYEEIDPGQVRRYIGDENVPKMTTKEVFELLKAKFKGNVYKIHKSYGDPNGLTNKEILAQWAELIGEDHILTLQDPSAVVDVLLGAIALGSGARELEEYLVDMEGRDQTKERINGVRTTLKGAPTLPVKVDASLPEDGGDDRKGKKKRL